MSKYDPLRLHLEGAGDVPVTMSFAQVAALVDGLPPSAYSYREWWSNNAKTTAPRHAWLPARRRVAQVDLGSRIVTFSPPGGAPEGVISRAAPHSVPPPVAKLPEAVELQPSQVRSLEAFLTFRGTSSHLRYRIGAVEQAVRGLTAGEALAAASAWGIDGGLLEGARLAKGLAAQVDVVLHAAGILHALPFVLEPGETVEYVSLGAGNTGRAHDLETDRRVGEFKFIQWAGGAETVRQDTLLIDIFNLVAAKTSKRRVMYLTGGDVPLRWLKTSKRRTRECLARKRRVPARFDELFGPELHPYVRDFWAAVEETVEVVDLTPLVPGLAAIDDGGVG